MTMLKSYLIALAFLVSGILNGQDITVKASFDTSRIYIGDQINFSVIVDQPAGVEVSIPVFRDSLSGKIEIIEGPLIDSSVISDNRIRISNKYRITSFDSGMYFIKPVFAELKDVSGIKRFYSDYSILEVSRVRLSPPDTASAIFDIVGPYRAPLTLGEIFPWILAVLGAALVVWMIIRYLPKIRKSNVEKVIPARIEPAHIIAFRELERLRDEKIWQSGETKKYYTRLTEILRQYLGNRYEVFSLELTTSETLDALVKTGFRKDEKYNILKSVLNGADLVKFAKYKPEPEENEKSFENSWDFVSLTKKEDIAEAQEEEDQKKKEELV